MSGWRLSRWFVLLTAIAMLAAACGPAAEPEKQEKKPPAEAAPAETAPRAVSPSSAADEAIRRALDKPVSTDFVETPLETAAAFFADTCGVAIMLDRRALDDVGIAADTPITGRVPQAPLRSALRLLLRDLDLTFMIEEGVLVITTPEEAEMRLAVVVYPVGDLVGAGPEAAAAFDRLVKVITWCVEATTWDSVGGPGSVVAAQFPNVDALVVAQTQQVHDEIAAVVESLRELMRQSAESRRAEFLFVPPDTPAEKAIYEALEKPVSFDFAHAPLAVALDHIGQTAGINVVLDRRSLLDLNIGANVPVTLRVKDVRLKAALEDLLGPLGLDCVVCDEVLLVCSCEESERALRVGLYPVDDLIAGREDPRNAKRDVNSLGELISMIIESTTWDDVGGPGVIEAWTFGNVDALMISNTREIHAEILALLRALRLVAARSGTAQATEWVCLNHRRANEDRSTEAILAALEKKAEFRFLETPLKDCIDYINRTWGIECRLDLRALRDVGLDTDTPITKHVKGISLGRALRLMLDDLDLVYLVRDRILLITTPEEAETRLTVGVYPVADLLASRDEDDNPFDPLLHAATSCLGPTTWDSVGGPGSIVAAQFPNVDALVVAQTQEVHDEIAALLSALRVISGRTGGENNKKPILLHGGQYTENPPAEEIRKALRKKATFDFEESPLTDFVDFIEQAFGIPCFVDARLLEDVGGLSMDTPITIHISGVSLESALKLVLRQLDLTWVICDEVLLITTPEEAETALLVGIYSVADLAACRDENDELWYDYNSLAKIIVTSVERETWDEVGGPGSIAGGTFGEAKVLVIRQILPVHEKINCLLDVLRGIAAAGPQDAPPPRRAKSPSGGAMGGLHGTEAAAPAPSGRGFF